jgi:hypothetical protein
MKAPQKRTLVTEEAQTGIVIDAIAEEMPIHPASIAKICWNTGEEKNCPACYLSKGCKAK